MTQSILVTRGREARRALPAPLTIASGRQHTAETILRSWFDGKSQNTIRNYTRDLEEFALFLTRALALPARLTVPEALARLFKESAPSAHEIVLAYRHYLESNDLSAASINRHLSALRSLTKLGRMLGMTTWFIEIGGLKREARRVTAGPTVDEIKQMLAATNDDTEAATRDYAIIVAFFCLGLRVSELCGLNLEETDLTRGSTWIKGKGRREKELVPVPTTVIEAIQRYLRWRGTHAGPLFLSLGKGARSQSRNRKADGRLETRSVLRIVRELGQRVGLHVWCHGLRHTSITQAAELGQKAGLGLEKIRAHSRHANLATLTFYLDDHDRARTKRTLADLVASTL